MEMKSNFFKIEELMPVEVLLKIGEQEAWKLLDNRLIDTIDFIKSNFKNEPIIINSWYWGGDRVNSGYRSKDCVIGASKSKHKLGQAVDMIFAKRTAEDVRFWLSQNKELLPHHIRLESNVNWVHIDVANETNEKIIYFKP